MHDSYVVAVVDDNDAMRKLTARQLENAGHRVECFTSGPELLASDLPGDLGCILLDMRMPGMDGLAVMQALKERGVTAPVVVLTGHGDINTAVAAMRLGAFNFLQKPCRADDMVASVRQACTAPAPAGGPRPVSKSALCKIDTLSERQRAVLSGIVRGQANKIIAFELGLSIRTVEAYRAQMLAKLGVRGTAEAVRLAIAAGMTEDGSN